jgi:hypothetical protein
MQPRRERSRLELKEGAIEEPVERRLRGQGRIRRVLRLLWLSSAARLHGFASLICILGDSAITPFWVEGETTSARCTRVYNVIV